MTESKIIGNKPFKSRFNFGLVDKAIKEHEEEKRQKLLEEKLNPKKVEEQEEAAADSSDVPASTIYSDLEWELKCPYENGEKKLFTYDASLERIKAINSANRHPYPSEAFGLIIDGLEGKLSSDCLKVYNDMMTNYGEWFSMAFERKGNELHAYLDPENLKWDGSIYKVVGNKLKYSVKEVFDLSGIDSEKWIGLNTFQGDFVKFMYGRKFEDLPGKMKEGNQRAQVYLPSENTIWPVGRGGYWFDIVGCSYYVRASRWVRKNFP